MNLEEQAILRQIIREELQLILSGAGHASPAPSAAVLDSARIRREDQDLLEAEERLPADEFVIYRAKIMAARLVDQGNPASAERMLKQAYAKSERLRRDARLKAA